MRPIRVISHTAMAVCAAVPLLATQDARGAGPQQTAPSMMRLSPILSALDANQDGAISAAELAGAPGRLKALDKDGNGALSREEAGLVFGARAGGGRGGERGRGEGEGDVPAIPGPTAEELLATLLLYDKNGDGKLAKSEVPDRLQGMFDRGDADRNGVLDGAELKQLAAEQATPGGGGERRGGGPGGRGRGGPGGFDVAFNALDANHDGEISADEITNATTSLKALDRNNDGTISEDEVRPGDGRGGAIARMAR